MLRALPAVLSLRERTNIVSHLLLLLLSTVLRLPLGIRLSWTSLSFDRISLPSQARKAWRFAMSFGHIRCVWAQLVLDQDLITLLRYPVETFGHVDSPSGMLCFRMKAVVPEEPRASRGIFYDAKPGALQAHNRSLPRTCRPCRTKTRGRLERRFRYARAATALLLLGPWLPLPASVGRCCDGS